MIRHRTLARSLRYEMGECRKALLTKSVMKNKWLTAYYKGRLDAAKVLFNEFNLYGLGL